MSRDNGGTHGETRSSALWGTGNRGGDSRANALWGKGGRGFIAILSVLFVAAIPLAGGAVQTPKQQAPTYVDPVLLAKAHTDPKGLTKMVIQSSENVSDAQKAFEWAASKDESPDQEHVKDQFGFVDSVAVTLKAGKVLELARKYPGLTITSDAPVELAGTVIPTSKHLWPAAENIRPFYPQTEQFRAETPTIAVIDSGIDKNRADFDMGSRVIAEKVFTTLQPNSPGDGRGHGTFVAGIAAGDAPDNAGAAPAANIVSLDVMNDNGYARTSDVIAACEWLYQNHAQYNVKVVNLSLHSTTPSNFTKDPLDKAVEKLWFAGVTVVVASGNYGNANGPSGVPFAPGNDPFVITVGAVDLEDSANARKHDIADWSAYGYTKDGFRKPELAAAGRFVIGPVPINSTLPVERPEHVVAPGYMRLSGTSFAAPIVAGAAAQMLARHPAFTPDQVKGALMQKARFIPDAPPGSAGVGEINAQRSADVKQPPNPNLALERFVIPDVTTGGSSSVFDAASWSDVAKNSAAWDAASWSDASWSDVSWSDVSWSDVSWSDVLAAADVTREDAAGGDNTAPSNDYELSADDLAAIAADPDLAPVPPPPPISIP